jgi:hypothetical protein
VREEDAWVGTRFAVRGRNFAHVLVIDGGWPPAYARAAGTLGPAVVLTFPASDLLLDAFAERAGFFQAVWGTRWGAQVAGVVLGKGSSLSSRVNWKEISALVRESYRLLAPAKLAAQVPRPGNRMITLY